jgi:hypothetical protein
MMRWIQLALFAVRMIWKYGPTVWKLGNKIYHEVEARVHKDGEKLLSEESAVAFNHKVVQRSIDRYDEMPGRSEINKFREDVWKRNNIGKTAKRLKDPRLRVNSRHHRRK